MQAATYFGFLFLATPTQPIACGQHDLCRSVMLLAKMFVMRKMCLKPFPGKAKIERQSSFEKFWPVLYGDIHYIAN
jgi:hypothetical protein